MVVNQCISSYTYANSLIGPRFECKFSAYKHLLIFLSSDLANKTANTTGEHHQRGKLATRLIMILFIFLLSFSPRLTSTVADILLLNMQINMQIRRQSTCIYPLLFTSICIGCYSKNITVHNNYFCF